MKFLGYVFPLKLHIFKRMFAYVSFGLDLALLYIIILTILIEISKTNFWSESNP